MSSGLSPIFPYIPEIMKKMLQQESRGAAELANHPGCDGNIGLLASRTK